MNHAALRAAERLFHSLPVRTHHRNSDQRVLEQLKAQKAIANRRYREQKLGIKREKGKRVVWNRTAVIYKGKTYASQREAIRILKISPNTMNQWLIEGRARYA